MSCVACFLDAGRPQDGLADPRLAGQHERRGTMADLSEECPD